MTKEEENTEKGALNKMKAEYLHVRIEPELKKQFEEAAKKEGRTMSNYVIYLIKKAVEEEAKNSN